MLQLETNRLRFVRYEEQHVPFITELVTDPRVMRFIGDGQPKDAHYARQLLERMQRQYHNFDDYGLHLLVHKETGDYVGHAGIVAQIIDDYFEIELGYWIHPNFWQQGYGFEAAKALHDYCDAEVWLERYVSLIQVGNEGSKRIARKNGMTREKTIEMDGKQVEVYVKTNDLEEEYELFVES